MCLRAYEALTPLGIILEVALRSEAALPGIHAVMEAHPEALLLAGTVITREQARESIGAGVAGIVSPDFFPPVVEECVGADVMCIPGGLADCGKQLALKAELYGCTLDELRRNRPWQWIYKVFPAVAGGEALRIRLNAWRSTYPGIRFVYTGGVTPQNVGALAREDPEGILCGSALLRDLGDPQGMGECARGWLEAVRGTGAEVTERTAGMEGTARSEAGTNSLAALEGIGAVVTFGEIILRLSPALGATFRNMASFDAFYGGAEANVAVALAQWGVRSRFLSALPENDLGEGALLGLQGLGVDTSAILRRGDRLGLYFLEPSASKSSANLIYDRKGSAISGIGSGDVDWTRAMDGATWFHFTGITPALSPGAAEATSEALKTAKELGLTVSMDLNYRSRLWSVEEARAVLTLMMEQVDVLMGNVGQLSAVFDLQGNLGDPGKAGVVPEAEECRKVGGTLMERFGLAMAAVTVRSEEEGEEGGWQAFLHDGDGFFQSSPHTTEVVDGVGGGDAFAAGLIFGILTGLSKQEALDFGVAASCLKQTMPGDFLRANLADVRGMLI